MSRIKTYSHTTYEIRNLVESDQPKAVEKIREKQIKQKEIQNQQHNIINEKLDIGTQVFLRDLRIKNKLEPECYGPFLLTE